MWRNWLCTVFWDLCCPCLAPHVNISLCSQNVSLASSKLQHPVATASLVLPTPRGCTPGLCLVHAWTASTVQQQIPLLDPAQVKNMD